MQIAHLDVSDLLNGGRQQSDRPRLPKEGQIARLREARAAFAEGVRFKPDDLVIVREGLTLWRQDRTDVGVFVRYLDPPRTIYDAKDTNLPHEEGDCLIGFMSADSRGEFIYVEFVMSSRRFELYKHP